MRIRHVIQRTTMVSNKNKTSNSENIVRSINVFEEIHLIEAINEKNPNDFSSDHLGIGYIASYAKEYGGYKNIKKYKGGDNITFKKYPSVVGISSVTQNFNIAKELARKIKKQSPNTKIIMGGIHITLLPNSAPKEADFIVLGEGEQTFLELLDFILKKKGKIKDIAGVGYKKGNKLEFTQPRTLISDVDKIPPPIRDPEFFKAHRVHIFTSRGCPYKCPFCSSAKLWKSVRFHSKDYVIKELEELIEKRGITQIIFADDLFVANKPRLKEIAKEIIARGWDKKITFSLNARANVVNEDLVNTLKSMNVSGVGMGLESGSERMLKIIKYGTVTLEQNYNSVKLFKEAGIKVNGYFMIGYPGETIEDIEQTKNFVKDTKIDFGEAFVAMPYPGTDLWDMALKRKLVSENMDWSRFQTEFERDPQGALIISDIDRDSLFKKYMEFKQIFLYKNIDESGGLFSYIKRLSPHHMLQLITKPKKIIYVSKTLFSLIFKKK